MTLDLPTLSETVLATDTPPETPRFGPRELFVAFFRALERHGVSYVVLPDYDAFPGRVASDVDYVVADADLPIAGEILANVAQAHGWIVAQTWQHEVFAYYSVVLDPRNPANHLALDAWSHFATRGCFLLRSTVLLAAPQRHPHGFFVPSPSAEFAYLLAKTLLKGQPIAALLPRLQEFHAEDPEGVEKQFRELFGIAMPPLRELPAQSEALLASLRARKRFGFKLRLADLSRRARRALWPSGLHIAVLGPDGAGKSTLIENLSRTLAPCFSRQRVFKFRPDVFGRIEPGTNSAPHERAPRSPAVSWAKVAFYFADWWLGWLLHLVPMQGRGALVIFDRNFDDMVIDQRRYLVQRVGRLTRLLRHVVPRADATFVLDADPAAVHARKPELPIEMIERQRHAYRQLAARDQRAHLICANQPADVVAADVTRHLLSRLAARQKRRGPRLTKRLFDLAVSIPAMVLLAPLLFAIALLVSAKLGTPVVFRQTRPGLHGRPFTIWKFRTMTNARDASGHLLPDAERLTRFGKWLRSTSLDELPELWNVIRGDMSLVGPRPLLVEYLPLYSPEQARRHDVLPGITGWAQVNGRNAASWPQKFKHDVWYVDHQSLWLDVKILTRTVLTVLRRDGINQPGRATADKFRGEQLEASA